MGIQKDLKEAIHMGREEVVGVLADHQVVPVVAEEPQQTSNLLGGSRTPDFRFEYQSDSGSALDRQTRSQVVDTLGLTSEDECETLQDEIRDHDSWSG